MDLAHHIKKIAFSAICVPKLEGTGIGGGIGRPPIDCGQEYFSNLTRYLEWDLVHRSIAKTAIFDNNRLTIGEQKNAIENVYKLLLIEFRYMVGHTPDSFPKDIYLHDLSPPSEQSGLENRKIEFTLSPWILVTSCTCFFWYMNKTPLFVIV